MSCALLAENCSGIRSELKFVVTFLSSEERKFEADRCIVSHDSLKASSGELLLWRPSLLGDDFRNFLHNSTL
jgi:hypothetical protein